MTLPKPKGCRITVWPDMPGVMPDDRGVYAKRCNRPIAAGELCSKHLADKQRLGGA